MFLKGLKSADVLEKDLRSVDAFLQEQGTNYLVSDVMQRADCYFLPTIQHIRVAGKAYCDYDIPSELTYLWSYLERAYQTEAFNNTCPVDSEIVSSYLLKAKNRPAKALLRGEVKSVSVPNPTVESE